MVSYSDIIEFFQERGPISSNHYYDHMADRDSSRAASRQRLHRALKAENRLCALQNVSLKHNRKIIYLRDQRKKEGFIKKLLAALDEEQSGYATAMEGVRTRGGCLTMSDFHILSGCPIKKRKGQLLSLSVLETLLEQGLLDKKETDDGAYISFFPARSEVPQKKKIRELFRKQEDLLLGVLASWFRTNGFASFDKVKLRDDDDTAAELGGYAWDLTAPSYLSSLRDFEDGQLKPGFVVADVHARYLNRTQVAYFLKKCDAIRGNPNNRPFIAVLLAKRFSKDALREGKERGYLFVTIEQFFGSKFAKQLKLVQSLYENPLNLEDLDIQEVKQLLTTFEQYGLNEGHIRGDLFEMIAYCLLSKKYASVSQGKKWVTPLGKVEVDVVATSDDAEEVLIVECKGYRGRAIEVGDVEEKEGLSDWIERRIPRMRAYLDTQGINDKSYLYAFWTTSDFSNEAINFLTNKKNHWHDSNQIAWKNRNDLQKMAREEGLSNLAKMIGEHFKPLQIPKKEKEKKAPSGLGNAIQKKFGISEGPEVGDAINKVEQAIKAGDISDPITIEKCLKYLQADKELV
jgi:hypothetical protein